LDEIRGLKHMKDFRVGYLYSLAPIHCGGEGNLGNILEITREVHTNFPYTPGSSLRGSVRDDVEQDYDKPIADRLFGKELENGDQMGVHQVWFGDARLLWVPMRTMSRQGSDVFMWVSCPTLLHDHARIARKPLVSLPDCAIGDRPGNYTVADAQVEVKKLDDSQKKMLELAGSWPTDLGEPTKSTWEKSRIILPDSDFQILMEHALWTQIRNKIQDSGSAEVFWTDVCIPRDTIFYYAWGYALNKTDPVTEKDHEALTSVLQGLIQVGGQANVGRGWVQGWIANSEAPTSKESTKTPVEV
jgi:CRISPR-associated protein Cmr4